jgi:hypothetical protein
MKRIIAVALGLLLVLNHVMLVKPIQSESPNDYDISIEDSDMNTIEYIEEHSSIDTSIDSDLLSTTRFEFEDEETSGSDLSSTLGDQENFNASESLFERVKISTEFPVSDSLFDRITTERDEIYYVDHLTITKYITENSDDIIEISTIKSLNDDVTKEEITKSSLTYSIETTTIVDNLTEKTTQTTSLATSSISSNGKSKNLEGGTNHDSEINKNNLFSTTSISSEEFNQTEYSKFEQTTNIHSHLNSEKVIQNEHTSIKYEVKTSTTTSDNVISKLVTITNKYSNGKLIGENSQETMAKKPTTTLASTTHKHELVSVKSQPQNITCNLFA